MKLRIPPDQAARLCTALERAGRNEIGGQIFGEKLAQSDFRATDVTVQKRRGTIAKFLVDIVQAARDAMRFYDRTNHVYTRFNYIGEWHSHPSFDVRPSRTDVESMRQLVLDSSFQGLFAVMVIVRLDGEEISAAGWVFSPSGTEEPIQLEFEK